MNLDVDLNTPQGAQKAMSASLCQSHLFSLVPDPDIADLSSDDSCDENVSIIPLNIRNPQDDKQMFYYEVHRKFNFKKVEGGYGYVVTDEDAKEVDKMLESGCSSMDLSSESIGKSGGGSYTFFDKSQNYEELGEANNQNYEEFGETKNQNYEEFGEAKNQNYEEFGPQKVGKLNDSDISASSAANEYIEFEGIDKNDLVKSNFVQKKEILSEYSDFASMVETKEESNSEYSDFGSVVETKEESNSEYSDFGSFVETKNDPYTDFGSVVNSEQKGVSRKTVAKNDNNAQAAEFRDWTEEWKAILDKPSHSPIQKLLKLLELENLALEFEEAAKDIVKTIVHERNKLKKSIPSINAGGIAGGIKYSYKNMFFKFTLDSEGLYSGDEFASKAAGRELQGLRSYLQWIVSEGGKLYTALFCLVDYAGYRVIASSMLPIGGDTLVYGSCDGGRTVMNAMFLRATMRDAAKWLNIKAHKSANELIYAPTDIEVHNGRDGCLYILDTARVLPPEQPPRFFQALLIPCDDVAISIDLPTQGLEKSIASIIPEPHKRATFLLGTVYSCKAESELNEKVSMLVGMDVFGDCLIVPAGYKGKFLYNLLRLEFCQNYSKPLSSDAFSGFGRHNFRAHNDEVIEASLHLKSSVLPSIVRYLDSGLLKGNLEDGAILTRVMHDRGLNMRLLGLVWSRSSNPVVKLVAMSEMTTRAAKQLFRGTMRMAKTSDQLRVVILNTLNLLLGNSMASVEFWETVMQLQLRAKYGGYGEIFERGRNYREMADLVMLFVRLCQLLGLSFPEVDMSPSSLSALFMQSNPFSVANTVFNIKQLTKPLISQHYIEIVMDSLDQNKVTLEDLVSFREQLTQIYSSSHVLVKVCEVQLSRMEMMAGLFESARIRLRALLSNSEDDVPLHLLFPACLILSRICSLQKRPLSEILSPILSMVNNLRYSENKCAFVHHNTFLQVCYELLVRAYHGAHIYDVAYDYAMQFQRLQNTNSLSVTKAQCQSIFGTPFLMSMCYTGEPDWPSPLLHDISFCEMIQPFDHQVLPAFPHSRFGKASEYVCLELSGNLSPIVLKGVPACVEPVVEMHFEIVFNRESFCLVEDQGSVLEFEAYLLPADVCLCGSSNPTDDGRVELECEVLENKVLIRNSGSFRKDMIPWSPYLVIEAHSYQKERTPLPCCSTVEHGENTVKQDWYLCRTCFAEDESKGICETCRDACHSDHDVSDVRADEIFKCVCGVPEDGNSSCQRLIPSTKSELLNRKQLVKQLVPSFKDDKKTHFAMFHPDAVVPTLVCLPETVLPVRSKLAVCGSSIYGLDDAGNLIKVDPRKGGKLSQIIRTAGGKFQSIACGMLEEGEEPFFVALSESNVVFSWGRGKDGELGHGDKHDYDFPKIVQVLSTVETKSIFVGSGFAIALSETNQLMFWGSFGDHVFPYPVPINVDSSYGRVMKVACCNLGRRSVRDHSPFVVLFEDGRCFHAMAGDKEDDPPVLLLFQELLGIQVIDIASCQEYSVYLSDKGEVYVAGRSRISLDIYPMSIYSHMISDLVLHSEKMRVFGLKDIVRICGTREIACAIASDGSLFYFGCSTNAGTVKKVEASKVKDVLTETAEGYFLCCEMERDDDLPLTPALDVAAFKAQHPVEGNYNLQFSQHLSDEGVIERDYSIFTHSERLPMIWSVPSSLPFTPLEIVPICCGAALEWPVENKQGQHSGYMTDVEGIVKKKKKCSVFSFSPLTS